jgi:pimeloyl-ACP methyl ester carboxylesterase
MSEHAVVLFEALIGVFTKAEESIDRIRPAVVFLNAGLLHRIGPNRIYVKMSRQLASLGFSSLRFDLSGVGDSPPRTDGLPLRTAVLRDVQGVLDSLSENCALSSFILVGLCSGADLAFRVALADRRVVGLVLIDGLPYRTLRSYVNDQFSRMWRVIAFGSSRKFLPWLFERLVGTPTAIQHREIPTRREAESALHDLTERGVNLLIIYTEGRGYNYSRQFEDLFPSLPTDFVQVVYLQGAEHTFELIANQNRLLRTVNEWSFRFQ